MHRCVCVCVCVCVCACVHMWECTKEHKVMHSTWDSTTRLMKPSGQALTRSAEIAVVMMA